MRFLKSRTESPGGLGVLGDVAHLFGKFTHKRARSSAQREMSRRVREGRPAFTAKTRRGARPDCAGDGCAVFLAPNSFRLCVFVVALVCSVWARSSGFKPCFSLHGVKL